MNKFQQEDIVNELYSSLRALSSSIEEAGIDLKFEAPMQNALCTLLAAKVLLKTLEEPQKKKVVE